MASEMTPMPDTRAVFVVHGRDLRLRDAMFVFLRAIGLKPLEFSSAATMTGKAAPYVGEILDAAFGAAQAIIVLFTPDDEARLRPQFHHAEDPAHETQTTPQARPNVLFEAGMAIGRNPDRTILIEVGTLRPFSDLGGRHIVRLNNSSQRRQELAQRLQAAGCPVDLSMTEWHAAGDFSVSAPAGVAQERVVSETAVAPTEEEIKILKTLSQDRDEDLTAVQIGTALSMPEQRTLYHLERLEEQNLVNRAMFVHRPAEWSLSTKGRAFLVEKNLL